MTDLADTPAAAELRIEDYEVLPPGHLLFIYRRTTPSELFPHGVECVVRVPLWKLREARAAGHPLPPIVHRCVVTYPPGDGYDKAVSPVL